jgi:Anthrone oxygenase
VNLRLISVAIALVLSAMLLGAGVYESVAVAPNFQGAPTSLEHARGFYHATNPGMFFRVLSPAVQLSLLLALVCNWKRPGTRWRLAGALALAILSDVITFKFHYPRNSILFDAPLTNQADLNRVGAEWAMGNYVRIAVVLTMVVLVMVSMIRVARRTAPGDHRLS